MIDDQKQKIVIGIVGMPLTGKTLIAKRLQNYLKWINQKTQLFVLDKYLKCQFNVQSIQDCIKAIIQEIQIFFKDGGQIAIYVRENSTKIERLEFKNSFLNASLIWVECSCQDQIIKDRCIQQALDEDNIPDYYDKIEAQQSFKQKSSINMHEFLDDSEYQHISYIKFVDFGYQIELFNINGYIQSKISSFMMNVDGNQRPIYLTRHGGSEYRFEDRKGGDKGLNEQGNKYAQLLKRFFQIEIKNEKAFKNSISSTNSNQISQRNFKIFTSTMKRTIETSLILDTSENKQHLKFLDDLNYGTCSGMTRQEIAQKFAQDDTFKNDKLRFRFPKGENFLDIINRIEPLIFEIERSQCPVLVISHEPILQCLYAYYNGQIAINDIPNIEIPKHTIIKLIPKFHFSGEKRFTIDIENGLISDSIIRTSVDLSVNLSNFDLLSISSRKGSDEPKSPSKFDASDKKSD